MAEEPEAYEMGREEETFVRTVALEIAMIQLFRSIFKESFTREQVKAICNISYVRSSGFNHEMNDDGDAQSNAWRQHMDEHFERLFSAIVSADTSWDTPE